MPWHSLESMRSALSEYVMDFGGPRVVREVARASRKDWKQQYALAHGLKESPVGKACISRVIGTQCSSHTGRWGVEGPCRPPGADHVSLWLRGGKPYVYVFQPYGLDNRTLVQLMEFCQKWGLVCDISSLASWHFYGHTLLVEIRRAERNEGEAATWEANDGGRHKLAKVHLGRGMNFTRAAAEAKAREASMVPKSTP